jgi:hypothetical protein
LKSNKRLHAYEVRAQPMPIWQITATPLAREINLLGQGGAGAGGPFQSDRSARSMTYFFPLRIAANPHRFRR